MARKYIKILTLLAAFIFSVQLPIQANTDANDQPLRILTLGYPKYVVRGPLIDPQYKQHLESVGFEVHSNSLSDTLSADYLKQFNVIILYSLPPHSAPFTVGGQALAPFEQTMTLVQQYLADGGGVVVMQGFSEHCEGMQINYNELLNPFGASFLLQQLREPSTPALNPKPGNYEEGQLLSANKISQELKTFLYPTNVLRFDDAYSTVPILVDDQWQILAMGSATSGTHKAVRNSLVGPRLTDEHKVYAIRQVGQGNLAISGIHFYYTLTRCYSQTNGISENHTGVIDGKVLHGEKEGRPSDFGKLLENTYRTFGEQSRASGFGGAPVDLPAQPAEPEVTTVVDWHNTEPAPTWQSRVWPQKTEAGEPVYDLLADPLAAGELTHHKLLIGAQTASGGGEGSVAEYRQAAIEAGYSAIFFTQAFGSFTADQWNQFVADCVSNSDDTFICVPGYQIRDDFGGSFLVLGAESYPDATWLTADGRALKQVNKLRFGNPRAMVVIDRPGANRIHPKMHKFYHAISVYTYNGDGLQIDRGFHAWQWGVASDSNPIPVAVHQVTHPDQVKTAIANGFQQILPAANLKYGINYFRAATEVYFETPLRHYLSEGPLLTGWSIFNKDLGRAEWNRNQYRIRISLSASNPIKQVRLYNGFDIAGRWLPNETSFSTTIDGPHNQQHIYFLEANDANGKRVLSPPIRTVTQNYRLRCGDRQNWLGTHMTVYTGTPFQNFPKFSLPMEHTNEGEIDLDRKVGSGNPAPILDFPFFSNHYQINEIELKTRYHDAKYLDVCFDSKPMYSVRPSDWVDGRMRMFSAWPQKREDFSVALVTVDIQLKRKAQPKGDSALWPELVSAAPGNNLLILPGKDPGQLATLISAQKTKEEGDPANLSIDLPLGTYAGGVIPLTPGLKLYDRQIGFEAPGKDVFTVPRDTAWHAEFLMLKGGRFLWRRHNNDWAVDDLAARAQREMGFTDTTPYHFAMDQGNLTKLAYIADFQAQNGGISGTLSNPDSTELLYEIPLRITGLSDRVSVALWRSDTQALTPFATLDGVGYVPLNADKTVTFYAGHLVQTDPRLFVRPVIWNAKEAWFRINNPTDHPIQTQFRTAPAIQGYQTVNREIEIAAGANLEIREVTP